MAAIKRLRLANSGIVRSGKIWPAPLRASRKVTPYTVERSGTKLRVTTAPMLCTVHSITCNSASGRSDSPSGGSPTSPTSRLGTGSSRRPASTRRSPRQPNREIPPACTEANHLRWNQLASQTPCPPRTRSHSRFRNAQPMSRHRSRTNFNVGQPSRSINAPEKPNRSPIYAVNFQDTR